MLVEPDEVTDDIARVMILTYQTRLDLPQDQAQALDAYAELYGRAERTLFAALAAGGDTAKLKSSFLRRFGLTARQFNAIAIGLKGKIASIRKRQPGLIAELAARIGEAKKVISNMMKRRTARADKPHQKKRRLAGLEQRLAALTADQAAGAVRLCFGSKKLFRAQFELAASGYADQAAWRHDWQAARANQFFVIGSKDETAGCQSCGATRAADGSLVLRLRLPDALIAEDRPNHLVLAGVRFAYGQDRIEASLAAGRAISYRFLRDAKGWRVFASTEVAAPERRSHRLAGGVGVDINADHLAVAELDRFGNCIRARHIGCDPRGRSHARRDAPICDAVKRIADWAMTAGKPVFIETLDFASKKTKLEKSAAHEARAISALAHAKTGAILQAACFRRGVEVAEVNPTSVIGAVNHAQQRGISVHQGAAVAVARRGLGLSERPTMRYGIAPERNGGQSPSRYLQGIARSMCVVLVGRSHTAQSGACSAFPVGRAALVARAFVAGRTPAGIGRHLDFAGETPARESLRALFAERHRRRAVLGR